MLPKTDAAKYVDAHRNTTLLPNGKIRFDQTGMEFPSTVTSAVLDAYASGKAFRRAVARRVNEAYDFSVHEPYIVPHRVLDERHFLYCTLTKATLPRDSSIVQNHISAKRFRRRLAEIEEAKRKEEELAEKQRERREKARAARLSKGGEEEEAEDRMEEDNDILDGIISSDDDDDDDDDNVNDGGNERGCAPESLVENGEENTGEIGQNGDIMDEDTPEERDALSTRSRKKVVLGEDDDSERRNPPKREQSKRKSKRKKAVMQMAEKPVETGSDVPSDHEMDAAVTGKRSRVKVEVPKKVRRARQRRKAAKQT